MISGIMIPKHPVLCFFLKSSLDGSLFSLSSILNVCPQLRQVSSVLFAPMPPAAIAMSQSPVSKPPVIALPVLNPLLPACMFLEPHLGHIISYLELIYCIFYHFPRWREIVIT